MTRRERGKTIDIEYADEGLGFFWFDPIQLRQSIVFIPVLVRALEENPGLTVGLREERILGETGPVFIHDLAAINADQVELIRTRYVQDAAVLLDGRRSDYRIRTDGVRHGLLELDVPEDRKKQLFDLVDTFIPEFAAREGVPFRCTWLDPGGP